MISGHFAGCQVNPHIDFMAQSRSRKPGHIPAQDCQSRGVPGIAGLIQCEVMMFEGELYGPARLEVQVPFVVPQIGPEEEVEITIEVDVRAAEDTVEGAVNPVRGIAIPRSPRELAGETRAPFQRECQAGGRIGAEGADRVLAVASGLPDQ